MKGAEVDGPRFDPKTISIFSYELAKGTVLDLLWDCFIRP